MKKKPYISPYCLHCYASLHIDVASRAESAESSPTRRTPTGATIHCDQCGNVNLVVDTHKLWTQERRFVGIENFLKLLVALAMVLLLAFSLWALGTTNRGPMGGNASHLYGVAVLAILLLAAPFWDLASITRKRGRLNGGVVWCVVGVVLGLLFTMAWMANPEHMPGLAIVSIGIFLLPFLLAPWTRKRWDGWRVRWIAEHQLGQSQ